MLSLIKTYIYCDNNPIMRFDDLTGIGVADNGLMVPLSAGVGKGLVIIFP